jgi:hypothetical protein
MDYNAVPAILFLKVKSLFEKINAEDCRFTPLPCEGYFWYAMCLYGLPCVLLKNFIGHMEPALRIQFSLACVEAVLAGKVTPGSTRFCHEIESGKVAGRHDF